MAFDYSELHRFLELSINNVGNPFGGTNFNINTHEIEREIISFFAEVTKAPKDKWRGYINKRRNRGKHVWLVYR